MKLSKLWSVACAVTLALFSLTAAVAVPILCRPFYYWQMRSLHLSEQTGLQEPVIRQAYDEVMDYLTGDAPFGTGALRWSEAGKSHFADCKILFRLDFILLAGSAALLLLFFLLYRKKCIAFYRFRRHTPAFWSTAGLALFFLAAGLWAVLDFNSLFTVFHAVLFPGKTNWIFDSRTDEIICILPEAFWARTGALVLILSLGISGLAAALWREHTLDL